MKILFKKESINYNKMKEKEKILNDIYILIKKFKYI
jgi:hypothetical protein